MSKYNPALECMVRNYRRELEAAIPNITLNHTDEELFKVIDYWTGMSDAQEQMDAVFDDVKCSVKR